MPPDPIADLVRQSASGDEAAQAQLIDQIRGAVRNAARQVASRPEDVEDLTQNIYLSVFRGLATFRGEGHFFAWLKMVARNEGRKFLRTRQRREDPVRDADREPDLVAAPPVEDRVGHRQLHEAFQSLPSADREALQLVALEGLSYAEAGQKLGCSGASIRGRVYRARRALRRLTDESLPGPGVER
ncbi:MAG: sigma-70 family RNA polymerase sigma factor [Acidobacteriota bacterium]